MKLAIAKLIDDLGGNSERKRIARDFAAEFARHFFLSSHKYNKASKEFWDQGENDNLILSSERNQYSHVAAAIAKTTPHFASEVFINKRLPRTLKKKGVRRIRSRSGRCDFFARYRKTEFYIEFKASKYSAISKKTRDISQKISSLQNQTAQNKLGVRRGVARMGILLVGVHSKRQLNFSRIENALDPLEREVRRQNVHLVFRWDIPRSSTSHFDRQVYTCFLLFFFRVGKKGLI